MKKNYLTFISVVSCFAVVVLHTNGCFWTFSTERYWFTANIIETVFYFAVPCFFMITGATLVDYRSRYTTREYFEKRISKTVIPFLFWSVVGMFYVAVVKHQKLPNSTELINGIINSEYVPIYNFFISLFSIYLSMPLFAAVERTSRKEVFSYLAIAGFVINSALPFINNHVLTDISLPYTVGVVSNSLIYVVIGYLLCNHEVSRKLTLCIYALAILGFTIHCYGTFVVSTEAGKVLKTFKGYNTAITIMYSTGVFLWLKNRSESLMKNQIVNSIVSCIAPYTFGIYLLQYFIYTTMKHVLDINVLSIVYRLGAPFIIIPIAIGIIWVMRKVPILKRFVP